MINELMSKAAMGLLWLTSSLLVYALFHAFYNLFLHPLRSYPGPLLWRAYQWPYVLASRRGTVHLDSLDLHEKYGPVVRVTPWMLSYTDSEALKTIYGHHNSATEGFSEMRKSHIEYQRAVNGTETILGAQSTADHARIRKQFSHAFSERGLREMQPRIQGFVELLIQGLKETAGDEEYIDIVKWYNWTTFDMIGDLAFGESFHCLKTRSTSPWIAAIFGNMKTLVFRMGILLYGLDWLIPYLTPKRLLALREANAKYSRDKMAKRIAMGTNRGDFLDRAIASLGNSEKGTGMTRDEMDSTASILILAGSETTATLLSGATFLLCKYPGVLEKLKQEVRRKFAREEDIDLMSVSKLDYLLLVLDEAMRMYPPVANIGARIVPKQGAKIFGKWVSGGTAVRVQPYAANHSPINFHRAEEFCPERWLATPPKEFANDNRAVRTPFSLGPRNCIGKNLAYAEMRLILAKVIWNFDMELDHERCERWMKDQKVYFIWEKSPLWVKLTPVKR